MAAIRKATDLLSVFIFCMVCLFLDCIASKPIPSQGSPIIYREVEEKAIPFADHGAVIIDDWASMPRASKNSCLKAFFYTCPSKVFLIARKSLVQSYLEGGNTIYNTDKWLCRESSCWIVFVRKSPELVLFGERTGKKNLPIDVRLGIKWSLMAPVKDFTNPNDPTYKYAVNANTWYEGFGTKDSRSVDKNKVEQGDKYYADLEKIFEGLSGAGGYHPTWAIYMVGFNAKWTQELVYFFDKNIHVKLCFVETLENLKFGAAPLPFPLIVSWLFMIKDAMAPLTLGDDQELKKFDFAGFFETLQSDKFNLSRKKGTASPEPILLNTLIKKFYGFFDGWLDFRQKNSPGIFAPRIIDAQKTGFALLVDKSGTPFSIDRKPIFETAPFATHGAIIVGSYEDHVKGPLLDTLSVFFGDVTNAIIIVPAKLIVQYLSAGNTIPGDRWACRRVPGDGSDNPGIEVYIPKSELVSYYGNGTNKQKEMVPDITPIDAILGIKWSQLEPVDNISEVASHKIGALVDMVEILMARIFVTPEEYQSYNAQDPAMRVPRAIWSVFIEGHGDIGQTVNDFLRSLLFGVRPNEGLSIILQQLIQKKIESDLQEDALALLSKFRNNEAVTDDELYAFMRLVKQVTHGLVMLPWVYGTDIASFFTQSFFRLLDFFNEPEIKPMAKLVDVLTCYGSPEKFEELRGKSLGYFLILRATVRGAVRASSSLMHMDEYFSTQQAVIRDVLLGNIKPIDLTILLDRAMPLIRLFPLYISIPQIRFPGEADFSLLSVSNEFVVTISEKLAKNFGKGKTLDISQYFKRVPEGGIKEQPVYPVAILFGARNVPFKLKISRKPASAIAVSLGGDDRVRVGLQKRYQQPLIMASITPEDMVHTIAEVDASDFTLEELVRAFMTNERADHKAFIIDKLKVKGSINDARDESVISEVKFIFVNYLDLEADSMPSYAYVMVEPISEKRLVTKTISQKKPAEVVLKGKTVGGFFERNLLEPLDDKKIVFTTYDTQEDFDREKEPINDLIDTIRVIGSATDAQ